MQPYEMNIPSKGLGDTVAKILFKLGFKQDSCSCAIRQLKLNRLFPYPWVK